MELESIFSTLTDSQKILVVLSKYFEKRKQLRSEDLVKIYEKHKHKEFRGINREKFFQDLQKLGWTTLLFVKIIHKKLRANYLVKIPNKKLFDAAVSKAKEEFREE